MHFRILKQHIRLIKSRIEINLRKKVYVCIVFRDIIYTV